MNPGVTKLNVPLMNVILKEHNPPGGLDLVVTIDGDNVVTIDGDNVVAPD